MPGFKYDVRMMAPGHDSPQECTHLRRVYPFVCLCKLPQLSCPSQLERFGTDTGLRSVSGPKRQLLILGHLCEALFLGRPQTLCRILWADGPILSEGPGLYLRCL